MTGTIPFDSDATRAAVTAAAHAVSAESEKLGITTTPEQCEAIAVEVVSVYEAFLAGVRYATQNQTVAGESISPTEG
ncbi:hypothetical protein [Phytohabitans kaempferiae]|uniref:DUF768 domain-containing protein n=1 Tax=Phytohabitans kaempferiae TaxID=1620943 RepID=A0ABV6ME34_9ACTN